MFRFSSPVFSVPENIPILQSPFLEVKEIGSSPVGTMKCLLDRRLLRTVALYPGH